MKLTIETKPPCSCGIGKKFYTGIRYSGYEDKAYIVVKCRDCEARIEVPFDKVHISLVFT